MSKDAKLQRKEQRAGCTTCGKPGCDRTQHSFSMCTGCGSAYCSGCGRSKTMPAFGLRKRR